MAAKKKTSSTSRKKAVPKPAVVTTLFEFVQAKTAGMNIELPSDEAVIDSLGAEFERAIIPLAKVDPIARGTLMRRIVRALNSVTAGQTCVIFRKGKPEPEVVEDLFTAAVPSPKVDLLA